ncbi:SpoIIE family protein phosphatase [Anabaena cylindrica FACHB-243]|uniref:Protein serine/threonine phosphatase with GAF(S) sensor(S) n=1 Tax=Anabaena cylindrica (strain ATCC 27899 / PCC 7122) TaxID=272123 RepID=K9ZG93_ANACC|nr:MULTISPECIES: SpoIIE family protein phosphatase [Anabaena]AFZ57764.1 protein serine/threonine phosphatase with GAF(s) sensor(s) [Anabaena cylindrica PCC 7122]MBD2419326.1 SpoIIE family protein phosphatase [Anabaena cylindrica FACHB-243]MBY5282168.1 SpoIIE family protein phosphatase [Anabaena sp. CCAP 1446/1C]MBY5307940.1 SpoIIE family protein phosphatase [Anabaena sp. CCAP 1446/1C]MCM2409142.1 SpoIIE family protein phosphatase [Anabaena sp. CCAP 1446/1C]
MNSNHQSQQQVDYQELEALRREVAELRNEEAAFNAQSKLLEKLVSMARSSTEGEVLKAALQTTLDVATDQTKSEKGSLFLLEPSGKVADAILSRTEVTAEKRKNLIGSVLDQGLAGWVIRNRQIGLIADTEHDDRWFTFSDQPYIVRSALAVPIIRGEELLGIITLLHSQPGHFSQETANLMLLTADQMALVLENARLYSKLDKYSKALDAELEKGRQIQIDFLPYELVKLPNWEIASCFHPARQVAGDFYDTFELPNNQVGLVIADVCDKGVGAALFMALMRSLIRVFSSETQLRGIANQVLQENQPSGGWIGKSIATNLAHVKALQAVSRTNEYVAKNHWQMSMFATMFFGILEAETGILTYINGGHESLFVIDESGIKNTLKSTGPAVGMMPGMKFKIEQIQLEPNDILIGYTDGVTEGKNPEGKLFTDKRLRDILEQPSASAIDLLNAIKTDLFNFIADAPQFDDITMLCVRRK